MSAIVEARLQVAQAAAARVVEGRAQREGVGELGHVAAGGVLPVAHALAAALVDHLLEDVEGSARLERPLKIAAMSWADMCLAPSMRKPLTPAVSSACR